MNWIAIALSRPALMAVAFLAGAGWGWVKFDHAADMGLLRAELAATQTHLTVVKMTAAAASEAEQTLRDLNDDLQPKLEAYEHDLKNRPSAACALTDGDVERLRGLSKGGRGR